MDETKKAKAAAEEAKAIAQGELDTASKTLSDSESHLKDLQNECMAKAEEYETSQHSRSEELTALDTAKKVLVEKTAGAADREYSFIQVRGCFRSRGYFREKKRGVIFWSSRRVFGFSFLMFFEIGIST